MGGMSVLLLMNEGPTLTLYQKNARYADALVTALLRASILPENSLRKTV